MPLLDLSNADTSGFGAIPSGTYDAEIFAAKMDATKGPTPNNPNPKLPKGTPMVNVQFRIVGGPTSAGDGELGAGEDYEFFNRRVFRQYVIPPDKIGKEPYEHAAKMKGMLVRFLQAVGYTSDELASEEFDLNIEDLAERPCRVAVKKKVKYGVNPDNPDFDANDPDNFDNEVTGVKPAGSALATGGTGLL